MAQRDKNLQLLLIVPVIAGEFVLFVFNYLSRPATRLRCAAPLQYILWGLVRLLIVALALAAQLTASDLKPNPFGVAMLCGLVGLVDIRRRGERALWGNLGVSTRTLVAVYVAAATIGEIGVFIATL